MKPYSHGLNCNIEPDSKIGKDCVIFHFCNIYGGSEIGDGVKVGSYTEISGAKIGRNVTIGAFSFIPAGVTIGHGTIIGPGVHFTHEFPPKPRGEWAPIVVGGGVMIGSKVVILPGVTIGDGAVVGAGAVVTKDIPSGEVWAGNPARRLRSTFLVEVE